MENKEKAISLFRYIKELYSQRYQVIKDVRNQQWCKFVYEIPNDEANIIFNYFDRIENEEDIGATAAIILQIKKPEFESCPQLPPSLDIWINDDWKRYTVVVAPKEKLEQLSNGNKTEMLFKGDKERVRIFDEWIKQRNLWVSRQEIISRTRNFFNELYYCYIDLERDSETIELMVGQGILDCETSSLEHVYHPVLLKRVAIEFNSKDNILSIIDSNTNPEIYTMLLQEIEYINHSAVKSLKEDLAENYYHPLDRNDTPDFLKSFAHLLYSDSRYEANPANTSNMFDKVVIYNNPVLFIRKRTGGVIKALEEIIEQIENTGELSGPILNLIGENVSQLAEPTEQLDLSQTLAAISGEDKDILLSKEANKEQLDIAKRIENYNAVLVQGPPGTGKTHTIANLIGHFLSQGKSILVTSHTKKALSVVKEKVVPELQNLCVSVLDDNNKDMVRSIDGITEYISSHSSLELAENTEKLRRKREKILSDLAEVRKNIYAIKFREYETITFGGKGYSVAEAARFVYDNNEELSYLPGKVVLYKSLPVSMGELELLYKTNEHITIREESELNNSLPNPNNLISPNKFEALVSEKNTLIAKLQQFKNNLSDNIVIDTEIRTAYIQGAPLCNKFSLEKSEELNIALNDKSAQEFAEWQMNAIFAGKSGGGFRGVWQNLITSINDAYQFSGFVAPMIIGKFYSSNEYLTNKTIQTLTEIQEYLSTGKKLSNFTLLTHKEWKALVSSIKIDNHELSSAEDCKILVNLIGLDLRRKYTRGLWEELIEKHGGIPFSAFGDRPEQACISYVNQIEDCLNWHNNTFEKLKSMALECGFNPLAVIRKINYTNPIDEVKYILHLMYNLFPMYISVAKTIYVEIPQIEKEIKDTIEQLQIPSLSSSGICQNLVCSLSDENTDNYRNNFAVLDSLYTKYFYQSERDRILKAISEYAPEWSDLIKNRVGAHGENHVPENIEGAWKWKQFAGIIDEITAQPFEELQHKAVYLNTELRMETAKLAENSAWYHLLVTIESDISKKQALQGWKLTTKKIGKGTGKAAPKLKREAQLLMARCQSAVPAWIMPVNKALESLDPTTNRFDIVIIDEASQSDISSLAILYLAKKIIIVGDDEQVSPSAIGVEIEKMNNLAEMYIKGVIPNAHLYDLQSSLYDIAKTTFPTLMLKEHFRCVPSIIGYSNRLSYDYKIQPLRDCSDVTIKPATIAYRVDGVRDGRKRNLAEARTIIALLLACIEQPEYEGMTFGAISLLGDAQAQLINELAIEKINPVVYEKRRILCGNASHFQGDERDVIFISLVDSNEGEGPLRISGEGVGKSTKQRYNVAASRAKNQLWVVHSLDITNDLKSGDMRKGLIEYVSNPGSFSEQQIEIKVKSESPFEFAVASSLIKAGYNIIQQWPIGSYRIDMVAVFGEKKIAIECDGELWHSGEEKIREDMERQAILERLGWRFIRIRGSEYFGNPIKTISRVISELTLYGIEPEQNITIVKSQETDLQQRVIAYATHMIEEWELENDR